MSLLVIAAQKRALKVKGSYGPVRFRRAKTVRNFAAAATCASRPLVLTAALEAARQGGSMAAFRKLARIFRAGSILSVTSCTNDRCGLIRAFSMLVLNARS